MGLNVIFQVTPGWIATGEEEGKQHGGEEGEDDDKGDDDPKGAFEGGESGVGRGFLFEGVFEEGVGVIHLGGDW